MTFFRLLRLGPNAVCLFSESELIGSILRAFNVKQDFAKS